MVSWADIFNTIKTGTNPNLEEEILNEYYEHTHRNLIVYYSGFLNNVNIEDSTVCDNDLIGLLNAVVNLDPKQGLDIIIHTPGGYPTAAEGIVNYLHNVFENDIRIIVPHMCMSAGSLIACASKEIILGKQACLGPVDPQFNGIPAFNIKKTLEEARSIQLPINQTSPYWENELKKYPAAFYYSVCDSISLTQELLESWLTKYMFKNDKNSKNTIKKIANSLNANSNSHARHFDYSYCKNIGLKVRLLEEDEKLNDIVMKIYYFYQVIGLASHIAKLITNQKKNCYIKTLAVN